jgi:hypothetical protein
MRPLLFQKEPLGQGNIPIESKKVIRYQSSVISYSFSRLEAGRLASLEAKNSLSFRHPSIQASWLSSHEPYDAFIFF